MHTVLFILAYIAFIYGAPAKVAVATSLIILLVTFAIQAFSKTISGIQPSFTEAFRAIGLSFFFLFLAIIFFASATHSTVALIILAINPLLVPVGLFGAFALGFSLSLRTTIVSSAAIAALSSVFAALLVVATRKFIFA